MEFDLQNQPEFVRHAVDYALQGWELVKTWAVQPEAWSQLALLVAAWIVAVLATRRLRPILQRWLTPEADNESPSAKVRLFARQFLPLLLPLLAYWFTGIGESVVRTLFDTGEVIAFGKRLILFFAVRAMVRDIITDPFFKLLGRWVLMPIAAVYVLGAMAWATDQLDRIILPLGNLSFTLLDMVRFILMGGMIFWLGRWSNDQSVNIIRKQGEMRPATRQLAEKAAEIGIFGLAFLIFMNMMGIPLTSLALLTGAVGVGLGFGLQKIASNFISGVILLVEGQATVGDFVELDGGEAGTIVKMTARAAILETYDGRWIVVPNEDFITTRVVNYSDSGSANRYEADFTVSYDTDINKIPAIIQEAALKLPFVLTEPEMPDCELRGFGDNGVNFCLEFWVEGIDDGKNRYTSDVLFAIWNALKENDIQIPYPHRVIEVKGPILTRNRG